MLRMVARELLRRRTAHRADPRAVADVQLDFAAELERAVDYRARADHDARLAVVPVEPAARLVDQQPAVDARIGADLDVAADRGDACTDARRVERDAPIHVLDASADLGVAAERDGAVDGFDRTADARIGADLGAAVDRLQRGRNDAVAEPDAAVHGRDILGAAAVLDPDRTIHGFEVAGLLVALDADRAVDLVDVDAARMGAASQQESRGDEQGQGFAQHGGSPGVHGCRFGCGKGSQGLWRRPPALQA